MSADVPPTVSTPNRPVSEPTGLAPADGQFRRYSSAVTASVLGAPVTVTLDSFPRSALIADGSVTPLHLAQRFGLDDVSVLWHGSTTADGGEAFTNTGSRLTVHRSVGADASYTTFDGLRAVLALLILAPEVLVDPAYAASAGRDLIAIGLDLLEGEPSADVTALVDASLFLGVLVEQSPPTLQTLAGLSGAGGLGLVVASGLVPPIALVTVPLGMVAIAVGGIAQRLIRSRFNPIEREINKYKTLLDQRMITQSQYDDAVQRFIAQDVPHIAGQEPPMTAGGQAPNKSKKFQL